jgi:hypothetical protein
MKRSKIQNREQEKKEKEKIYLLFYLQLVQICNSLATAHQQLLPKGRE